MSGCNDWHLGFCRMRVTSISEHWGCAESGTLLKFRPVLTPSLQPEVTIVLLFPCTWVFRIGCRSSSWSILSPGMCCQHSGLETSRINCPLSRRHVSDGHTHCTCLRPLCRFCGRNRAREWISHMGWKLRIGCVRFKEYCLLRSKHVHTYQTARRHNLECSGIHITYSVSKPYIGSVVTSQERRIVTPSPWVLPVNTN